MLRLGLLFVLAVVALFTESLDTRRVTATTFPGIISTYAGGGVGDGGPATGGR